MAGCQPKYHVQPLATAGQQYRLRLGTCNVGPTTMEIFLTCLVKQDISGSGLAAAGVVHMGTGILSSVSRRAASDVQQLREGIPTFAYLRVFVCTLWNKNVGENMSSISQVLRSHGSIDHTKLPSDKYRDRHVRWLDDRVVTCFSTSPSLTQQLSCSFLIAHVVASLYKAPTMSCD